MRRICAVSVIAMLTLGALGCQSVDTEEAVDLRPVTMKGINVEVPEQSALSEAEPEWEPEEPEDEEEPEYRGLVVIDPGHQAHGNSSTEPLYPDGISSETKAKVSSGTSSVTNGYTEYELNLDVSLQLRDELVSRGYEVIMTRETNDVDISNAERATVANEAGADVFVRIHANGSENRSASGMMTICQTASNPANGDLYAESRALSDDILDATQAATGLTGGYVWETDTMVGINWARVPSTIVEMGYMTNPTEDAKLQDSAYQALIVQGIADGIDQYMSGR